MTNHEPDKNMGKQIAFYIMFGIACSSVGYGVSQETMRIDVQRNTDAIRYIENKIADQDMRISQLVSMQQATLEQSSQVISLIKLQNQILNNK